MSLHKRLAFQRSLLERRSLRVPSCQSGARARTSPKSPSPSKSPSSKPKSIHTPLDLELDLAAQQAKLGLLQEEIDRLRGIKARLEEHKKKGGKELPSWLHEQFQLMLAKVALRIFPTR